ncbi:ribose-5-phosphate isomerase [Bryobacterales bacterium F-183]|nr:ribose-5-phosphate isomerase [Bryobacterales bacterium F-183]
MRIAIAGDHAGLDLKNEMAAFARTLGHDVHDLGAHEYCATDDYPDFAELVGRALQQGQADRAILICGSGVGVSVAANKMKGVRAALCHDTYSAHQGVEHDDMNVLVLGARIIASALAEELVRAFLGATFTNEERHARRLAKVKALEASNA